MLFPDKPFRKCRWVQAHYKCIRWEETPALQISFPASVKQSGHKLVPVSDRWCIHCEHVCRCVCTFWQTWMLLMGHGRLCVSIALYSVTIFPVNCFGLKAISAAESKTLKNAQQNINLIQCIYPHISEKQHPSECKVIKVRRHVYFSITLEIEHCGTVGIMMGSVYVDVTWPTSLRHKVDEFIQNFKAMIVNHCCTLGPISPGMSIQLFREVKR